MNVKDSDKDALIAAVLSATKVFEVDTEKVANQLGLSVASIPSKFSGLRKRYNLKVKLVNTISPQKGQRNAAAVLRLENSIQEEDRDDNTQDRHSLAIRDLI